MVQRLDPAQIAKNVADLQDWGVTEDARAIVRSFKFGDFAEAFSFMTRVAIYAERADHHPEWSNVYNQVDIRLTTHDCDGVSELDLDLARRIDAAAQFKR